MKRFMACILALTVLLSAGAFAEDAAPGFTLRNGLRFGDSEQTILAREGLTQIVDPMKKIIYGDVQFMGTAVGLDNTLVSYYVSEDKGLTEMLYRFDTPTAGDAARIYGQMREKLIEKYALPLPANSGLRALKGSLLQRLSPDTVKETTQWLVPDGDGYVKIDLIHVNGMIYTFNILFVWIDYTYFPAEEVQRITEGGQNSWMDEL